MSKVIKEGSTEVQNDRCLLMLVTRIFRNINANLNISGVKGNALMAVGEPREVE